MIHENNWTAADARRNFPGIVKHFPLTTIMSLLIAQDTVTRIEQKPTTALHPVTNRELQRTCPLGRIRQFRDALLFFDPVNDGENGMTTRFFNTRN